jgi:hypothetical protein
MTRQKILHFLHDFEELDGRCKTSSFDDVSGSGYNDPGAIGHTWFDNPVLHFPWR